MTFLFLDSPVVIELVSPVRTLWYVAVLHSSLFLLNWRLRLRERLLAFIRVGTSALL